MLYVLPPMHYIWHVGGMRYVRCWIVVRAFHLKGKATFVLTSRRKRTKNVHADVRHQSTYAINSQYIINLLLLLNAIHPASPYYQLRSRHILI